MIFTVSLGEKHGFETGPTLIAVAFTRLNRLHLDLPHALATERYAMNCRFLLSCV